MNVKPKYKLGEIVVFNDMVCVVRNVKKVRDYDNGDIFFFYNLRTNKGVILNNVLEGNISGKVLVYE